MDLRYNVNREITMMACSSGIVKYNISHHTTFKYYTYMCYMIKNDLFI